MGLGAGAAALPTRPEVLPLPTLPCPQPGLLGEVGEVLGDLGDEGQGARGAVIGVLLEQAEQGRGHDGRAQEAQEQRGADQPLADVGAAAVAALLSPRGKNFFELSWEDTEMTQGQAVSVRVGVSGVSNHTGKKSKLLCKAVREADSVGPSWMPRPQKTGKTGIWNKLCTAALQDSVAVPWGALSCRKLSQQGEHLLKNHQQHWNLWSLQGGLCKL